MPNHNRLTLPNLPAIEIQSLTDEGHGEEAARCCATLRAQESHKLAA